MLVLDHQLNISQGQDKPLELSQVTGKLQGLLPKVHMVGFILATEPCLEISQVTELCLEILLVQFSHLVVLLARFIMLALEDLVDLGTRRHIFHLTLIMSALDHLQRQPTLLVQDK